MTQLHDGKLFSRSTDFIVEFNYVSILIIHLNSCISQAPCGCVHLLSISFLFYIKKWHRFPLFLGPPTDGIGTG